MLALELERPDPYRGLSGLYVIKESVDDIEWKPPELVIALYVLDFYKYCGCLQVFKNNDLELQLVPGNIVPMQILNIALA